MTANCYVMAEPQAKFQTEISSTEIHNYFAHEKLFYRDPLISYNVHIMSTEWMIMSTNR
jgi:hypothetical protein